MLSLWDHGIGLFIANFTSRLFEMVSDGFYNKAFGSIQEVEEQLVRLLRQFENSAQRLASVAGFDWIISALNY